MEPKELALFLSKREHIAVLGSKEMLDEAAVRYGLTYNIRPVCEQDAQILAAINFNTRQIVTVTSVSAAFAVIREHIINFSRYSKAFPMLGTKMDSIFNGGYTWNRPDINANVLAETVSRWLDMIEVGFEYQKDSLNMMLEFCQLNELYPQCAIIQEQLDKIEE